MEVQLADISGGRMKSLKDERVVFKEAAWATL
jgi:hypothetical protein